MHILSAIAWKLANINNNLDTKISAKPIDKNLLIATWNIRAFGEVTRKWERT